MQPFLTRIIGKIYSLRCVLPYSVQLFLRAPLTHDCTCWFLLVKGSPDRGNNGSKGIQACPVLECLLNCLAGSETVRNGVKTEGASAVKTRAGRRCDHEGQELARPLELDSVQNKVYSRAFQREMQDEFHVQKDHSRSLVKWVKAGDEETRWPDTACQDGGRGSQKSVSGAGTFVATVLEARIAQDSHGFSRP